MATWTYDGANTLSVSTTFADANQAAELRLDIDNSNESTNNASGSIGSPVTLTVTDINDLTNGDVFTAHLASFDTGEVYTVEARIFTKGSASSGASFTFTYSYNGSNQCDVSVQIDGTESAHGILIQCDDPDSTVYNNGSPGATGSVTTVSITDIGGLSGGALFGLAVYAWPSTHPQPVGAAVLTFGTASGTPAAAPDLTSRDWRWDLCDRYGAVIQTLDPYVMGREMIFDLNRPCSVAGRVASNNAVVNTAYVDGYPYLSPGNRTLKCWRYEGTSWVLRFAGIVWQVGDEADTDTSYTSFTAFDPWQFLFRRMIRRNDGNLKKTVHLANNAAAAVKRHLEKTIEYAGACYIDPDDVDAYFQPLLVYLTMEYEQEYLGRAFIDVTDTGVVDVRLNPVDRTDGILCIPTAVETYGSDKTAISFQYDTGDRTAMGWNRVLDMDQVANSITNFTGKKKAAPVFVEDSDSQLTYGVMEDAKVFTEIQHTDALTALSNMELAERKDPRELIQAVPLPETGAVVFEDYFLGDTVTVETSNSAREAVSGIQRIYGFTLDIDDEGVERITELRVSPVLGG